jgi:uncharacterized protein YjbI with pentapeptide repeats
VTIADDEPLESDGLRLSGERVVGVTLDRPQLTDIELTDCDLSGVVLSAFSVRRGKVVRTRLRDCVWGGGLLQDVFFDDCPSEQLGLRFSTLQRVTFVDCRLAGADFYGATFDRVTFTRCDLTRAHFDSATVKHLAMHQCDLAGVSGALDLRGASIDFDDLPALAPSLAREVGLRFNEA